MKESQWEIECTWGVHTCAHGSTLEWRTLRDAEGTFFYCVQAWTWEQKCDDLTTLRGKKNIMVLDKDGSALERKNEGQGAIKGGVKSRRRECPNPHKALSG